MTPTLDQPRAKANKRRVFLRINGQIHSSLGPLLHSTFNMMKELSRFGALMLVITFGFALAFYAMFGSSSASQPDGGDIPEYDTYYSSLLTLFASMLGNFDFEVGWCEGAGCQPVVGGYSNCLYS